LSSKYERLDDKETEVGYHQIIYFQLTSLCDVYPKCRNYLSPSRACILASESAQSFSKQGGIQGGTWEDTMDWGDAVATEAGVDHCSPCCLNPGLVSLVGEGGERDLPPPSSCMTVGPVKNVS